MLRPSEGEDLARHPQHAGGEEERWESEGRERAQSHSSKVVHSHGVSALVDNHAGTEATAPPRPQLELQLDDEAGLVGASGDKPPLGTLVPRTICPLRSRVRAWSAGGAGRPRDAGTRQGGRRRPSFSPEQGCPVPVRRMPGERLRAWRRRSCTRGVRRAPSGARDHEGEPAEIASRGRRSRERGHDRGRSFGVRRLC